MDPWKPLKYLFYRNKVTTKCSFFIIIISKTDLVSKLEKTATVTFNLISWGFSINEAQILQKLLNGSHICGCGLQEDCTF